MSGGHTRTHLHAHAQSVCKTGQGLCSRKVPKTLLPHEVTGSITLEGNLSGDDERCSSNSSTFVRKVTHLEKQGESTLACVTRTCRTSWVLETGAAKAHTIQGGRKCHLRHP